MREYMVISMRLLLTLCVILAAACYDNSIRIVDFGDVDPLVLNLGIDACECMGGIETIETLKGKTRFTCKNGHGHGWWPLDGYWSVTMIYVKTIVQTVTCQDS